MVKANGIETNSEVNFLLQMYFKVMYDHFERTN